MIYNDQDTDDEIEGDYELRSIYYPEDHPPPNGTPFLYVNQVYKKSYARYPRYDDQIINVKSVNFSLSRCGSVTKTIVFLDPVSKDFAIGIAENYLSQPFNKEYYRTIIQKRLEGALSYKQALETYHCRGDLLFGRSSLVSAVVDHSTGELTLICLARN